MRKFIPDLFRMCKTEKYFDTAFMLLIAAEKSTAMRSNRNIYYYVLIFV